MGGKTSSTVKNRYNAKAYDRLTIVIPKGRKATVEAFAARHGMKVNGLVNRLLQRELGLSDAQWRERPQATLEGDADGGSPGLVTPSNTREE